MGRVHATPQAALLPEALTVYTDLEQRGLLHRWVLSVRSSQAFALNLFAPLAASGVRNVLDALGLDAAEAEPPMFEWSDPLDRLAESSSLRPHRTQIDVVLRGASAAGQRLVALVEVKLTEGDFGWCSAYENPDNPHPEVCRSPGLFGGAPEWCFQLANHGHGRRRYDEFLADTPVVVPSGCADTGGCLVRRSLSQPMRSLAMAEMLLATGEADRVVYGVCSPAEHDTIWRRLNELRAAFPDTAERTTRWLSPEDVAAAHSDGGETLAARYPALVLN